MQVSYQLDYASLAKMRDHENVINMLLFQTSMETANIQIAAAMSSHESTATTCK
jgi:hypothetical protein